MEELDEVHSGYVENCGKILAPLYYNFAKHIEKHAEHPIHVSYRSAHPAKLALDHIGVKSKELWINRAVAKNLNDETIQEYCEQQGLNKKFTFIDNGYSGTIPNLLEGSQYNKLQTILLTHGDNTFSDYFAYLSTSEDTKHEIHSPYAFSEDLIENLPREYESFKPHDFERNKKGTVIVNAKKKGKFECNVFKTFFKGMSDGFAFCSADEKKFLKYLDILDNAKVLINDIGDPRIDDYQLDDSIGYSKQVERVFS